MTARWNMPVWLLCFLVILHGSHGQLGVDDHEDNQDPLITTPSKGIIHPPSTTKHSTEESSKTESTTRCILTTILLDMSNATDYIATTTVSSNNMNSSYRAQNMTGLSCKCSGGHSSIFGKMWIAVLSIVLLSATLLLVGFYVSFTAKKIKNKSDDDVEEHLSFGPETHP